MARQKFGQFSGSFGLSRVNTVDSLLSGYFIGSSFILAGGTTAVFRSENYVPGTSGLAMFGDGSAEFNNVTIYGDLYGNWNGAIPVDLSTTFDAAATTGFALDSSAGSAQFMGDIFLGGTLAIIGLGSVESDDPTNGGWSLQSGSFGGTLVHGGMAFWSNDAEEVSSGFLAPSNDGGVRLVAPQLQSSLGNATYISLRDHDVDAVSPTVWTIEFVAPTSAMNPDAHFNLDGDWKLMWNGDTDTYIRSAVADQISAFAGGVEMVRLTESTNDQVLLGNFGSTTVPSLSRIDDQDTGWSWSAANTLSAITGGATRLRVTTSGIQITGKAEWPSAGGPAFISELWGLNLNGASQHPIRFPNSAILHGTGFNGSSLTAGIHYAYPPTSGGSANAMWLLASGSLYYMARLTSRLVDKEDIDESDAIIEQLAAINLRPNKHYRPDDKRHRYGMVADWLVEQDELLGEWSDEHEEYAPKDAKGRVVGEDGKPLKKGKSHQRIAHTYDTRAVDAVLAAKLIVADRRLERLEARVAELEMGAAP